MSIRDKIKILLASCTSGRLPGDYTELEYIECNNDAWFDTEVACSIDTEIEMDVVYYFTDTSLIDPVSGMRKGERSSTTSIAITRWSDGPSFAGGFACEWTPTSGVCNIISGKNYHLTINRTAFTANEYSCVLAGGTPTGVTLLLGYNSWGRPISDPKLRIQTVKIGKSEGLVFNGIPAKRKSDNVLGMYDLVTDTFFTNAGTGSFIPGPEVI